MALRSEIRFGSIILNLNFNLVRDLPASDSVPKRGEKGKRYKSKMRLVVKTGSAILSKAKGGLDRASVQRIAAQLSVAHKKGHQVILVTSGAIAAGVARLGWNKRPTELRHKQSAAAVGQVALMEAYEAALSRYKITPAQLLLTREDLANKARNQNIQTTLLDLLKFRTIPIINENDSVSTDEIKFGDNDTLAAIVAIKVRAHKLILLSDVPGLYAQDEKGHLTDLVITTVDRVTPQMERRALTTTGSKMSVGGIITKLRAAKMATAAGVETWLASGYKTDSVTNVLAGKIYAGTRFRARKK